jgi:hypothetical protein
MNDAGPISKLDSVQYLYLRQLSEPRDNALRLIVEEAAIDRSVVVGSSPELTAAPELAHILRNASPIESIEGCRTFELYWKRYVAYLVTEEGVGSCGRSDDEVFTGRLLRHYSKSHFLDHLAHDTGGHMRPLQHYKLICLNHLIDVASEDSPEIHVASGKAQAGDLVD